MPELWHCGRRMAARMSDLPWRNRRIIARRTGWPAGALAECERLDQEHPGWAFWWLPENRYPGWERPAGFSARQQRDSSVFGPSVFGPDVDALLEKIGAVEQRIAAEEAERERLWASIRRGLR